MYMVTAQYMMIANYILSSYYRCGQITDFQKIIMYSVDDKCIWFFFINQSLNSNKVNHLFTQDHRGTTIIRFQSTNAPDNGQLQRWPRSQGQIS